MWVQEGNDCKDTDDVVSTGNTSLFTGIYSIVKPKQTVTTIGIPMHQAIAEKELKDISENKNNNNITSISKKENDIQMDEKEKEPTPRPRPQLKMPTTPISPAQFLENMQKEELHYNFSDDMPQFPGDVEMDNLADDYSNDFETEMDVDLTIFGKKLSYISVSDEEKEEKMKEIEFDETAKEEKDEEEIVEIEWDYYIPKRFNGLDIERAIEWKQCLDFTQDDNLLIIELYSTVFGASDVMYPFIDEILHNKNKNKKIKFIRLSINRMNEIKEIREIIINNYFPTPIPIYIFIKNGILSDELYGTKPKEFEQIIEKYVGNNPFAVPDQSTPVKYSSIFTQRPPSSYLSPIVKKNKATHSNTTHNVENIRNLIHNFDINHQTTKLSESRSAGTTTQLFV